MGFDSPNAESADTLMMIDGASDLPLSSVSADNPTDPSPEPASGEKGVGQSTRGDRTVELPGGFSTIFNLYGASTRDGDGTQWISLEEEARELRERLVRFVEFDSAHNGLLNDDRIIVLCGQDGVGKQAAAIGVLSECVTDMDLRRIAPSASFAELADREWMPRGGYLMTHPQTRLLRSDDEFDRSRLICALEDAKAYLVITTVVAPNDLGAALRSIAVNCSRAPAGEVVRQYFARHLDDAVAEQWTGLALDEFDPSVPIRDAIMLARRMVADPTLAENPEALRREAGRIRQTASAEIEQWFKDAERTDDEVVLMMTLAVLSGAPVSSVNTAERLLRDELDVDGAEPAFPDEPARRGLVKRFTGRTRYSVCKALVSQEPEPGADPSTSVQRIRFESEGWRRALLGYLWGQPDLHEPLVNWLRRLGISADEEILRRAGLTAGHFATIEPLTVRREIVEYWAKHKRITGGLAAGHAISLLMASGEDDAVSSGFSMLRDWTKGSTNEQWTAALACGMGFGQRFPEEALSCLADLLHVDEPPLEIIGLAMHWICSVDDAHAQATLHALERWTQSTPTMEPPNLVRSSRDRRLAAMLLFQFICSEPMIGTGATSALGGLNAAALRGSEDDRVLATWAVMMARSLLSNVTRRPATKNLRSIVAAVGNGAADARQVEAVLDSIVTASASEHQHAARSHLSAVVAAERRRASHDSPMHSIRLL